MAATAFQDLYPDDLAHCYGCGKNNEQGHQLKSYWLEDTDTEGDNSTTDSQKTIAHFTPKPYHTAIPGFVYGGLLASLIDCHATGSASAMAYRQAVLAHGSSDAQRFVTGALNVSFLAPTPIDAELELIGTFTEIKERKIVIDITLTANGTLCATGHVIAIKMPDTMSQTA